VASGFQKKGTTKKTAEVGVAEMVGTETEREEERGKTMHHVGAAKPEVGKSAVPDTRIMEKICTCLQELQSGKEEKREGGGNKGGPGRRPTRKLSAWESCLIVRATASLVLLKAPHKEIGGQGNESPVAREGRKTSSPESGGRRRKGKGGGKKHLRQAPACKK